MNYLKIVNKASQVVLQAGAYILEERKAFDSKRVEIKGRNDMVSYVDKTAEDILVKGLQPIIPEAGFITEEETIAHEQRAFTWIIDPLDGTTNFIHGVPVFAVSVGLLAGDELVAGIVYEVNNDELFTATKGGGSFLNAQSISVAPAKNLKESLISTGFPVQDFKLLDNYLSVVRELVQHSHGLRRFGSAATDLAYVACGRYDGFFEYNLNAWDVSAGILLVKEAGGKVTDFSGADNALFGRELIAGATNHEELLELIKKHWRG